MTLRRETTIRRREELRTLTRQDILRAAASVFARAGFENAKMQDIAEAAGFGAASLYNYFPSKDAIYAGLFEHVTRLIEAPLDARVDPKASFPERLEALIRAQLMVMRENLESFVLFMQPTQSVGAANTVKTAYGAMVARFEHWLSDNSSLRERGRRSPREVAFAVFGVGQACMMHWMLEPQGSPETLAPKIVDQVLYGIVGRIAGKIEAKNVGRKP